MKHLALLLVLAAALRMSGLLPFESREIADLIPVEALTVSMEEDQVVLHAGECRGQGDTWQAALEDLHEGAEGTVFLQTAEYVVLSRQATGLLPQMVESAALRPGAAVCVCAEPLPAPEEAGAYLSAHDTGVTLQQVQAELLQNEEVALPVLVKTEGGLRLHGTTHG